MKKSYMHSFWYKTLPALAAAAVWICCPAPPLTAAPDPLVEMRKQALKLEKDGEYKQAHELYTTLLNESRTTAALIDQVRILIILDSLAAALPLCREALGYNDAPTIANAHWGQIQFGMRNYAEALQAFKVYEGKGGKDPAFLKLKAQCEKMLNVTKGGVQYVVRNEKRLNTEFSCELYDSRGNIASSSP